MPANIAAGSFEHERAGRQEQGHAGKPRLVAICHYALGHPDQGRANVHDYYSFLGEAAGMIDRRTVRTTQEEIREAVKEFGEMGADELLFTPAPDNLDEIAALAESVF
jgi:hypothetical protein